MTPSAFIASFIKGFEKCKLSAYRPTPNDVPTIGYGATGPDIHMGLVWTKAQADERFGVDLARFGKGVTTALGDAATTQTQFDAMVSFAYNVGLDAFDGSTLLRLHRAGAFDLAHAQFARWNRQDGIVLHGLTARREAEARIYADHGKVVAAPTLAASGHAAPPAAPKPAGASHV